MAAIVTSGAAWRIFGDGAATGRVGQHQVGNNEFNRFIRQNREAGTKVQSDQRNSTYAHDHLGNHTGLYHAVVYQQAGVVRQKPPLSLNQT